MGLTSLARSNPIFLYRFSIRFSYSIGLINVFLYNFFLIIYYKISCDGATIYVNVVKIE